MMGKRITPGAGAVPVAQWKPPWDERQSILKTAVEVVTVSLQKVGVSWRNSSIVQWEVGRRPNGRTGQIGPRCDRAGLGRVF